MKPQHAQLLAADLDEATVIRYLDRFLMFYVRTADRLERTATWFNKLEGGIDYLRRVVIEDALGIAAELERTCSTWSTPTSASGRPPSRIPRSCERFRPFINSDAVDPSIVFVPEREQHRAGHLDRKGRAGGA